MNLTEIMMEAPDSVYEELYTHLDTPPNYATTNTGFVVDVKEASDEAPGLEKGESNVTRLVVGETWLRSFLEGNDKYAYLLKWETIKRLDEEEAQSAILRSGVCRCVDCMAERRGMDNEDGGE